MFFAKSSVFLKLKNHQVSKSVKNESIFTVEGKKTENTMVPERKI